VKKVVFLALLVLALALPSIASGATAAQTAGPAVNSGGLDSPLAKATPATGDDLMAARRCIRWATRRRCARWGRGHRYCRRWGVAGRRCLAHRAGRCVRWGHGRRICRAWGYKGRRCLAWRVHRRCVAWR